MEIIEKILALLVEYGPIVGPYVGVCVVTHQLMNQVIKPIVRAHRNNEGYYESNVWRYLRSAFGIYPMLIGLICATVFSLNVLGGIASGILAQTIYYAIDKYAEKKGYDLVPDSEFEEVNEKQDFGKSLIAFPKKVIKSLKPKPPTDKK